MAKNFLEKNPKTAFGVVLVIVIGLAAWYTGALGTIMLGTPATIQWSVLEVFSYPPGNPGAGTFTQGQIFQSSDPTTGVYGSSDYHIKIYGYNSATAYSYQSGLLILSSYVDLKVNDIDLGRLNFDSTGKITGLSSNGFEVDAVQTIQPFTCYPTNPNEPGTCFRFNLLFKGFGLNPTTEKVPLDTRAMSCPRSSGQALVEQIFDEGSFALSDLRYTPDKFCLSVSPVLTKPSGETYTDTNTLFELANDGTSPSHPGEVVALFYVTTTANADNFCKGEGQTLTSQECKVDLIVSLSENNTIAYVAQTNYSCETGTTYDEFSRRCRKPLIDFCVANGKTWADGFDWEGTVTGVKYSCYASGFVFDPDHPSEFSGACPSGTSEVARKQSGEIYLITCSDKDALSVSEICGGEGYALDLSLHDCYLLPKIIPTVAYIPQGGVPISTFTPATPQPTTQVTTQPQGGGYTPTQTPTQQQGEFPWSWVLVGAILLLASGYYFYITRKKKR